MSINASGILSAVQDHARSSGYFSSVSGHEPKGAPGDGLHAACWVDFIGPDRAFSGAGATSGLVRVLLRVQTNMLADPQDEIDPAVLTATEHLLSAYSADFTLGGLVNHVDLLGRSGTPLSAEAGYLNQDGKLFRVMVITIPLVVDNIWSQAP